MRKIFWGGMFITAILLSSCGWFIIEESFAMGDHWVTGRVPAMRGRILDHDGQLIAWSERYFALYYQKPADAGLIKEDLESLADKLPFNWQVRVEQILRVNRAKNLIFRRLNAKQIVAIHNLVKDNPRFIMHHGFERLHGRLPGDVHRLVGKTAMAGKVEVGFSGWERYYEKQLRGQDGLFKVKVNSSGHWIPGTWEEIRQPKAGFDVYVPVKLQMVAN